MDFPTPTPMPTPDATPLAAIAAIDPSEYTETIAVQAVSWWNYLDSTTKLPSVGQLVLLIIIVIVGIQLITRALNSDV